MIQFGVSRLRAYTNGLSTGCASTGGTGSAAVATGDVWIGGVYCGVSGTGDINIATAADTNTGVMYLYAFLSATNVSGTASLSFATGSSSIVLNYPNVGTDIAIIAKGEFGTGSSSFTGGSGTVDVSGLTGLRPFGKAMNCTLNVTYDTNIARGGTLIFGNDMKLYNGAIEGTLEYADIDISNIGTILGSTFVLGAGAGCGTFTLSATEAPIPFMIETQQLTDGITSTVQILKCYSPGLTMNFDRENYTQPSMNFQAIANNEGNVMKILTT